MSAIYRQGALGGKLPNPSATRIPIALGVLSKKDSQAGKTPTPSGICVAVYRSFNQSGLLVREGLHWLAD